MEDQFQKLQKEALEALQQTTTVSEAVQWRVLYLGKKGKITTLLKGIAQLPPAERPEAGQVANLLRARLQEEGDLQLQRLQEAEQQQRLLADRIDVTLPGPQPPLVVRHPWVAMVEEIEDFFLSMGYQVAEGPEVECDTYNFTMLNLPKDHPARDMQDSFYLDDTWLLRTHTSPVQIRTMQEKRGGPLRMIAPGFSYRRDHDDATHSHQFGQVEGLVVDEGITMADLRGVLQAFMHHLFGKDAPTRLRGSYFPFTEPSVEMDVLHPRKGFVEVLGAGMVHPRVLAAVGYDVEKYTGFAFGVGIDRLVMLRHGLGDIRSLYENDLQLFSQLPGW